MERGVGCWACCRSVYDPSRFALTDERGVLGPLRLARIEDRGVVDLTDMDDRGVLGPLLKRSLCSCEAGRETENLTDSAASFRLLSIACIASFFTD